MREKLRKLWHWWHDIPESPGEQAQRASEIILLAMVLTTVNVAILIMHMLVAWKQFQ